MNKMLIAATAALSFGAATAASATDIQVTPSNMQGWSNPAGENTNGSATITGTAAHDGNGSIELLGDRSRFVLGTLYPNASSASFGSISTMASLTFDWMIAQDSISNYNPLYTPALRFTIYDGSTKKEMIWEGAYNNTYNTTSRGNWYATTALDNFYIGAGNENAGKSIASWAGDSSLAGYYVTGISVGQGGGANAGYHAFADNVTYTTTSGASTTYRFDVTGAVPEPASWMMMVGGFGVIGGALRRRKIARVTFA